MSTTQNDKAQHFRQLHSEPPLLALPNAWDVASAVIFEQAGFRAIGTSSAGIAASLGYPDGEKIGREEMLRAIERIAKRVAVPVTADVEAGYGRSPEAVAETVKGAIAAGAVGINLEDSNGKPDAPLFDQTAQIERILAAREAARQAGVAIVINARTDVFLLKVGESHGRLAHAVQRANAYRDAGADCLFVPGVGDSKTIGQLAKEIQGPLNILAYPITPSVEELAKLGVARVSLGSGPARAALAVARSIARELLHHGTFKTVTESAIPYAELNHLLANHQPPKGEENS
jgi:2-methylisocitrate lyase-like PEP mutase family enzyme